MTSSGTTSVCVRLHEAAPARLILLMYGRRRLVVVAVDRTSAAVQRRCNSATSARTIRKDRDMKRVRASPPRSPRSKVSSRPVNEQLFDNEQLFRSDRKSGDSRRLTHHLTVLHTANAAIQVYVHSVWGKLLLLYARKRCGTTVLVAYGP